MLILMVAVALPVSGHETQTDSSRNAFVPDGSPVVGVVSTAGETCAGGQTHQDSIENGYRIFGPTNGTFVEQFTAPAGNDWTMVTVCTCWLSLGGGITVNYDLVVFDDDGVAGIPGTEIMSVTDTAVNPSTALPGTWYGSAVTLAVPAGETFYIGARFDGNQDNFLCSDETGTLQTGYRSPDGGSTWDVIQNTHPSYVALGVAFVLEADEPEPEPEPEVPAVNFPNKGEIMISAGAPVQTYAAAGAYPTNIVLPADYDGNGFDTYTVTSSATVAGETWYAVWVGGEDYLWVPASQVQVLR